MNNITDNTIGEHFGTYESQSDAARQMKSIADNKLNSDSSSISKCIKGEVKCLQWGGIAKIETSMGKSSRRRFDRWDC